MKKIVVSGATSMIGTALLNEAIARGTEVYAIVRRDSGRLGRLPDSPLLHVIYGKLDQLSEIKNIPDDCDVFYHLAWAGTDQVRRDDPLIQERNVRYTIEAVELAERCGCHRFVGAGSQAEYGIVEGVINDETRYLPIGSYGVAKLAAGILSRKMCEHKGMDHVWGRIFSVYGPHDNEGTMLNNAIGCFLKGKEAHFSHATHYWNYLFESDAGAIFYLLGDKSIPSGTWMVANPESRPLKEYIETMMKVFGSGAKGVFAPERESGIVELNVDMSETLKVLKYMPKVSFCEGIEKVIEERRENEKNKCHDSLL